MQVLKTTTIPNHIIKVKNAYPNSKNSILPMKTAIKKHTKQPFFYFT
ncbi:protein of unknown function [Tenacibaculum jejuense]|uniref:Uncharacterized protein n=1 Tax=Tenacibaculum jejuense TaxID=584609 RepID=A0A238U7K7_9FLAO|nr:protein of unknown function [Tenacibaculum jejuense]